MTEIAPLRPEPEDLVLQRAREALELGVVRVVAGEDATASQTEQTTLEGLR